MDVVETLAAEAAARFNRPAVAAAAVPVTVRLDEVPATALASTTFWSKVVAARTCVLWRLIVAATSAAVPAAALAKSPATKLIVVGAGAPLGVTASDVPASAYGSAAPLISCAGMPDDARG